MFHIYYTGHNRLYKDRTPRLPQETTMQATSPDLVHWTNTGVIFGPLQNEFTAHLLSDAPDRNAFLKQHAAAVRGLATFGPMAVDGCLSFSHKALR